MQFGRHNNWYAVQLQTSHRTTTSIYIWDASLDANDTNWCSLCTPCMDMASGSGGWWFRVKEFSLARIRDVPKLSRYNKKSGWLQKKREAKGGWKGNSASSTFKQGLKTAAAYAFENRNWVLEGNYLLSNMQQIDLTEIDGYSIKISAFSGWG